MNKKICDKCGEEIEGEFIVTDNCSSYVDSIEKYFPELAKICRKQKGMLTLCTECDDKMTNKLFGCSRDELQEQYEDFVENGGEPIDTVDCPHCGMTILPPNITNKEKCPECDKEIYDKEKDIALVEESSVRKLIENNIKSE